MPMKKSTFISFNPNPYDFPGDKEDSTPIITCRERPKEIIITCIFPGTVLTGLEFTPLGKKFIGMKFRAIKLDNTGYITQSGKALLPSAGRFIRIPHGYIAKLKNVAFSSSKAIYDENGNNFYLIPSQEELTETSFMERHYEYHEEFYKSDEWFPKRENMVKLTGPLDIDGYRAMLLHVRPMQYKPKTQDLIGYPKIVITLQLEHEDTPSMSYDEPYPDDLNRKAFKNFFIPISEKSGIIPGDLKVKFEDDKNAPRFLIISHPEFKTQAEKLRDYKNGKLKTEVILTDNIGRSVDELKSYIRHRRGPVQKGDTLIEPRLRYVLLLGDVKHIETEYFNFKGRFRYPSDYYYSTKTDPDKNDPCTCILPWLSVGRIPVSTEKEADTVIEKIIEFEKKVIKNGIDGITLDAYFQDTDNALDNPKPNKRACRRYIRTMEEVANHMNKNIISKNYCGSIEKIYYQEEISDEILDHFYVSKEEKNENYWKEKYHFIDGEPIDAEKVKFKSEKQARDLLISRIKKGQRIIATRGHSSFDGWKNPDFLRGHLYNHLAKNINNSIFFSINCFKFSSAAESFICFLSGVVI